jgi:four helix bundle protein
MQYKRFDEVPVWRDAINLGREIYSLTEHEAFKGRYSLRDQIERAAVSVSNNIAEGFERGTKQELLTFLYIARGSAGEVLSMLFLLEGMKPFRSLDSEFRRLKAAVESIGKQLGGWIRVLKNSELKGQRYVTEKTRRQDERQRQREEFLKELEANRERAVREREENQNRAAIEADQQHAGTEAKRQRPGTEAKWQRPGTEAKRQQAATEAESNRKRIDEPPESGIRNPES